MKNLSFEKMEKIEGGGTCATIMDLFWNGSGGYEDLLFEAWMTLGCEMQ